MPSTKTTTKTIRIANETAEFYEKMSLRTVAESTHHLIESGVLGVSDDGVFVVGSENKKTSASVYTDLPALEDLRSMANCFGITVDDLLGLIDEALNEGTILIEGDRVVSSMPHWVERFEEVCRDKCLDPDKIGESAVKAIERGTLQ